MFERRKRLAVRPIVKLNTKLITEMTTVVTHPFRKDSAIGRKNFPVVDLSGKDTIEKQAQKAKDEREIKRPDPNAGRLALNSFTRENCITRFGG